MTDAPDAEATSAPSSAAGAAREGFLAILLVFLRLGLTSFGGPVAHLGYLRSEFVTRRRWIGEGAYADLVALAQFMPGPASSQTGFALGVLRGGLPGGLAAWLGFTTPSAAIMVLAAYGVEFAGSGTGAAVVHGLKLVAVAVVAQAVWGMAGTLCPDRTRATIAVAAAIVSLLLPSAVTQIAVILAGAAAHAEAEALLAALPLAAGAGHALALAEACYRAGALVFGGGHVVLPLLERSFVPPGWISAGDFLAGYGVAQAMPGPLFSFAAFLGAAQGLQPSGIAGAAIALAAVFLPGLLLVYGMLPFWDEFRARSDAQAVLRGVNAAVVGILLAALYDPIWTAAVKGPADVAIALAAFTGLVLWKLPVIAVIAATALAGIAAA